MLLPTQRYQKETMNGDNEKHGTNKVTQKTSQGRKEDEGVWK